MTEKNWSHEKKWCVIPRHISLENPSILSYMKVLPKAVILGSQCEKNNQKEVIDICGKRKMPVYKIKR